jgi:hypothetical protein
MNMEAPPAFSAAPAPPPALYKDRTGLLIVFGVIEILMGLLCALLFVVMVASQIFMMSEEMTEAMGGPQPMNLVSSFIYLFAGVFLIWMGIGTLQARRWARALMLTTSSIGLAFGTVALISMGLFMPAVMKGMPTTQDNVPSAFMGVVLAIMLGFMFCVYILIPGVFVLFYRSPHVKATCEAKDPVPRWTDKCPLPVLAVSLVCGFGGAWTLLIAPFMPVVPIFGTLLTGPLAVALIVVMAAVMLLLSWGCYRLRIGAWWGCVALILFGGGYAVSVFRLLDFNELYRTMGYTEKQMEIIESAGMAEVMSSPTMLAMMIGTMALYLGYVVYVRRFFPKPA